MSNEKRNKQILDCINNGGRFDFDSITLIDTLNDKIFVSNLTVVRGVKDYLPIVQCNNTVIYDRKDITKVDNINSKYVLFTDNNLVTEFKKYTKSGEMPYTKKNKLQGYSYPAIKEYGIFKDTIFLPLEKVYTRIKNLYVSTSQQPQINQYPNLVEMAVNLGLEKHLTNHEYNRSLLMPLVVKTLYYIDLLVNETDINSFTNYMEDLTNTKKKNNKFYVIKEGILPIDLTHFDTELTPNRNGEVCTDKYTFVDTIIGNTEPKVVTKEFTEFTETFVDDIIKLKENLDVTFISDDGDVIQIKLKKSLLLIKRRCSIIGVVQLGADNILDLSSIKNKDILKLLLELLRLDESSYEIKIEINDK